MLLRDLVARAYSGYGQCIARRTSSARQRSATPTRTPLRPAGFSAAVRLGARDRRAAASRGRPASEVDVARGSAGGVLRDLRGAASAFGREGRRRPCAGRDDGAAASAGPPGLDARAVVLDGRRAGVYVKHLRLYRYATRGYLVGAFLEDLFADPSGVADEVVARLVGREAAAVAAAVAAANPVGRPGARDTTAGMEEGTRRLRGVHWPYNRYCTRWSRRGGTEGGAARPGFLRMRRGRGEGG